MQPLAKDRLKVHASARHMHDMHVQLTACFLQALMSDRTR